MKGFEHFNAFCVERERIRQRKEAGEPWPWTDDKILQYGSFCNIFREDDKTTRWFKKHIRDPYAEDPDMSVMMTSLFRTFNLIETGEDAIAWFVGRALPFEPEYFQTLYKFLDQRRAENYRVFTGAYMACQSLEQVFPSLENFYAKEGYKQVALESTIEGAFDRLVSFKGFGPFKSYEIVTDLRWTCVLRDAPDKLTWANIGPGSAKGLELLIGDDYTGTSHQTRTGRSNLLKRMQELLAMLNQHPDWQTRQWELRDVEHALCEYGKYRRLALGDKPKRRYTPNV